MVTPVNEIKDSKKKKSMIKLKKNYLYKNYISFVN